MGSSIWLALFYFNKTFNNHPMAEKPAMMTLFNVDEEAPHEVLKEWQGMPECISQDQTPDNQLIISFRNQADRKAFGELIGQRITPKTKSVWHPKVDISRYMDKQYKYVNNDDYAADSPSE